MYKQHSQITNNYVSIDLEIHPENNDLLKIGAVASKGNGNLCFQGEFDIPTSMKKLDELCKRAEFIIGHNICDHDIPWIKQHFPKLQLLSLPIVDTLYLSPLAFPKNPYHRLVKDYKIVKESVNDPVGDAKLTISLFNDQIEAFKNMRREAVAAYGYLLNRSYPEDSYNTLFQTFFGNSLPDTEAVRKILLDLSQGKVCNSRATDVFNISEIDSPNAVYLAYILAWIQVAGENSVLPPWVRYRFPIIPDALDTLRANPCLGSTCSFCSQHYDPRKNLWLYFGFKEFLPVKN